jgi:endonuclease-3
VTDKLFKKIKTPENLLAIWFADFERSISSVNYYHTKAKHIRETAKILKQWKKIPSDLDELLKLPGVGIKTWKLIAHVLYDKPFIAVDTHIHRVSNRLGIVKTISPEKTSELLEKCIPDSYKDLAHHTLVLFGRYYCTAKNPKCETCKLQKICLYYKNTKHSYNIKSTLKSL